jgi:hypothetical protein
VAADRHFHRRPGAAKRFRQIERNADIVPVLPTRSSSTRNNRFGTVEE